MAEATENGPKPYLIDIDPRELMAHPCNVRTDLGDLDQLAVSIGNAAVGMVEYPVIVPDGDRFVIIAGHRRTAASVLRHKGAVAAYETAVADRQAAVVAGAEWTGCEAARPPDPLITCIVRPDLAGKTAEHLVAMLLENTDREGLTPAEVANGYAQLAMFDDYPPEKIAAHVGRPVEYVNGQLALARLPGAAHVLAAQGRLDLEDAAALVRFEGDRKAMQRILKRGDTALGVRHAIADEQRRARCREEAEAKIAALANAGAVIIKRPNGYPYECREVSVGSLVDADGAPLDPDTAALRPGFAAFLDANQGYPRVEIVCLNPEASDCRTKGYRYSRYISPEQKAAEERERAAQDRLRAALDTAAEVRQRHIVETCGNAKAIKELVKGVLRDAAIDPRVLHVDRRADPLMCKLAGVEPDALPDNAGADRVNRVLVARWLAHQDDAVVAAIKWTSHAQTAVTFLDWLVTTTGYSLSGAETTLRDMLHDRLAPLPEARETPDQVDRPCDACGAEPDEPCDEKCPLQSVDVDEDSGTAYTDDGETQPNRDEAMTDIAALDEPSDDQ